MITESELDELVRRDPRRCPGSGSTFRFRGGIFGVMEPFRVLGPGPGGDLRVEPCDGRRVAALLRRTAVSARNLDRFDALVAKHHNYPKEAQP